jgi:hypothetical protein
VRGHVRPDLDNDLSSRAQRNGSWSSAPKLSVDVYERAPAAERGDACWGERLSPGAEHGPEREPGTDSEVHDPGRVKRYHSPETTGLAQPAVRQVAWCAGADPCGEENHSVRAEDLNVRGIARSQRRLTAARHAAAYRRLKSWPTADRPYTRKQRRRYPSTGPDAGSPLLRRHRSFGATTRQHQHGAEQRCTAAYHAASRSTARMPISARPSEPPSRAATTERAGSAGIANKT